MAILRAEGESGLTKKELEKYRTINRECEQLGEQMIRLKSRILSPKGQLITDAPASRSADHDGIGKVCEIVDTLQKKYFEKLLELCELQLSIEQAIESLDGTERVLMRYRYLQGLTWEEVAAKMNYTYQWVCHIHGVALKKLDSN